MLSKIQVIFISVEFHTNLTRTNFVQSCPKGTKGIDRLPN